MIECLQLRGLSQRTQEAYVRAVRQLAEHYHKSPELISEEELRQYFLFLKNVKHYSRNTMTVAICGLKFFFEQTLQKEWTTFSIVRPAREKKLPVILSPAEVRQLLAQIRSPRYQVCLATIYSCGLRLQEGTHLQVADIDSARLMIHVRHGKGAKDRYVPLPKRTLELLRQYWQTHRNQVWLFPAESRRHHPHTISAIRTTEDEGIPAGTTHPTPARGQVASSLRDVVPPSPIPHPPSRRRGLRPRWRRALVRLATDGKAWRLVARHGFGTARGGLKLLRPRVSIAVGHPDPAKLARLAGYWHASVPLFSALGGVPPASLELRFQDRLPTFAIRAEGGFSALSLLLFGIRRTSAFPWIGLSRRAWFSWWQRELEGWRGWVYKRLQE
jgi:hypothetical protein